MTVREALEVLREWERDRELSARAFPDEVRSPISRRHGEAIAVSIRELELTLQAEEHGR